LLLVVIAAPAAYALAWGDLPRRMTRILIAVSAVLAVVPPQTVIVALGQVFDQLHLFGAPTALTVVHVALGVPLAVLLLRAAFASVPPKVVRARQIDPEPGSALFTVVARSLPAVVTVAVLEFVLVWNDLVVGLLLGGPESGQVTLVLMEQSRQFATSTGVLAAGAVVATALPLGLVLATGKWLVRGLTEGVRR
jgi:alpha-glucoside transport system permease protein